MTSHKILVTGGAGYIGSHVVIDLLEHGWSVVVLDNLRTGLRELLPRNIRFVHGDAGDTELVAGLLQSERCRAVMHFAGSTVVPESVTDPLSYYRNNTAISRNLLAACALSGVKFFIFSSTAAVYGNPETLPVSETTPTLPITPYGRSKLMTEAMLQDIAATSAMRFVALRYFNVAGADPLGRSGQATPNATHLIKVACEVAVGKRPSMAIYGTDYDTPDGTCIRDFIHVSDLASAHVAALDHLTRGGGSQILNCGYGWGISVRQVIETTERLAGRRLDVVNGPRREGDIISMVADGSRLRRVLGWAPRHAQIDTIIGSALDWERRVK
ncbi:MAG: UDP-glucose 4-epimerase GalE [Rhodospirillaceae bacterium]|nr:UDP-glucose 4-epimerase GalE [Rhodospirillales bacterium]